MVKTFNNSHYFKHKFLNKPSWLKILRQLECNITFFHSPDILCGTNNLWIIIIEGVHCISVLRWPTRPIQPSFSFAQMALVTTRLRNKLNSPLSRLEEYRTLPYSLIDHFKTVLTQTLIHEQASYWYIIIVWSGHRQGSNQVFMLYSGSICCCS